jgi:hypothetical protein
MTLPPRKMAVRLMVLLAMIVGVSTFLTPPTFAASNDNAVPQVKANSIVRPMSVGCALPPVAGVGSGFAGSYYNACNNCENDAAAKQDQHGDQVWYCTYNPHIPNKVVLDLHYASVNLVGCGLPDVAGSGSFYKRSYVNCLDCQREAVRQYRSLTSYYWYCTWNPGRGNYDLHYGN